MCRACATDHVPPEKGSGVGGAAYDVDEDDITHTDAGASSFLAALGIDQAKYKSLDPNKVKMLVYH